ncbi:MAG: putative subtilase-type serine protease precursor [Schlesneria sp.]|nr:putative subtilase-type serine protease precursor [Schlesneria sp.]
MMCRSSHHFWALSFGMLSSLVLSSLVAAQEPSVNSTVPGAVTSGASTILQLNGGNLAPIKKLWTSFPCESVLAEGIDKNGENPGQVTYKLNIPGDVACGVHAMRVVTDKGVSPLRFLIVDDLPSIPSAGSNTTFAAAQVISVPTAVDGTVPNLSWQFFKFPAQPGQRIAIEVLARRIGSSLDPMIRLMDTKGRELAFNDDTPGLSGDASLVYTFKDAGEYIIELRDIKYGAGAYRLRIGDFPIATVAYPLAIQRGTTANVTLAGFNVDGLQPVPVTIPGDQPGEWRHVSFKRPGAFSGFSTVEIATSPQFLELEPNNTAEQANRVEFGHDINGRLDQPGDVDRFLFAAKKDQSATFIGITRQQGSPSDLNFRILNKDGGQVAAAEDTGTSEGTVAFKAPADGDYVLVVEDLNHRGGSEHAYRIEVTTAPAQFALATSLDTFNIPVGGNVMATVTATRKGYAGPIELSATNLPPGVTASKSVIGAGRNDAVITLQAPPEFAAGDLFGISIVGTARIGEADVTVPAEIGGVLKARNNNMRWTPAPLSSYVATSAAPAPGFTWRVEPNEVVFGKDLSAKVKLIGSRAAGFEEAVVVAIAPPQNGLPAGVTVAVKNIDKGQTEAEIVISANNQAPLGDFTAGLTGTLKQGDKTATQGLALRLKLAPPMTIKLDPAGGKIAKSGELVIKAIVERNPAFTGAVNVTLQNLPAGVTAAVAMIPADQSSVDLKLVATAEAAAANVTNLTAKADAMAGNAKVEATSAAATLTVE